MDESFLQVGANIREGVVKLRAPDVENGYVVQCLSPVAACTLATWLEDGTPGKVLRVTDGKRWVEQVVLPGSETKLATDLRNCAKAIESWQAQRP